MATKRIGSSQNSWSPSYGDIKEVIGGASFYDETFDEEEEGFSLQSLTATCWTDDQLRPSLNPLLLEAEIQLSIFLMTTTTPTQTHTLLECARCQRFDASRSTCWTINREELKTFIREECSADFSIDANDFEYDDGSKNLTAIFIRSAPSDFSRPTNQSESPQERYYKEHLPDCDHEDQYQQKCLYAGQL